jgi:hypothetical protein
MKIIQALSFATLAALLTMTALGDGGGSVANSKAFPKSAPAGGIAKPGMSCKMTTRSAVDSTGARGSGTRAVVYTAHSCPDCSTKEVVKGSGKLATRKLVHNCTSPTLCCEAKN